MDYELAKKLKEAGFPSTTRWEVENNRRRIISVKGEETLPCAECILSQIPSEYQFSESNTTIGAVILRRLDGSFVAGFYEKIIFNTIRPITEGKTPEEAVAKLWLELNKK